MGISRTFLKHLLGGFVAACVALPAWAQDAVCRDDAVFLKGDWGTARFSVEVADDNHSRAQGLMNRASMPTSAGMLFVYERPQSLTFWMRNTLIELDMIFLDRLGVVQHVHHRAKPMDETTIFGGKDLLAALEINGGLAQRLGIAPGSVMRHPAFPSETAAWPC